MTQLPARYPRYLSSTSHRHRSLLPNSLKPPSLGQDTPLHQPNWKGPRHLPAGSAECREECGAAQLTRSHEPCRGRLPAPARSAGPRAAAGGAATEPAPLGSKPPRRLLTPPLRRSLSSRGKGWALATHKGLVTAQQEGLGLNALGMKIPFLSCRNLEAAETQPGFGIVLLDCAPPLTSSTDRDKPGWYFIPI